MNTRTRLCFWWMLTAGALALANPAGGDARLEKLFSRFISPCCWQGNLLQHDSPKADELRAEIRRMVAEGKTDDEIKTVLVGQYSQRILSLPEGASGNWLWWMTWVAVALGAAALAMTIRRLRRTPVEAPTATQVVFDEDIE